MSQQQILDGYDNVNNNWAFGSIATVHKAFPQLSRNQVKEALAQNDIYTRFHPYRKSKDFIPYYVREKRYLIQADICYMGKEYAAKNDKMYHLLVVIDLFTKFVWLKPLHSLQFVHVVPAMREILISMKPHLPRYLQTDRGKEFTNEHFKSLMNEFNILHYYATSDRKAAVVERVNLTLQKILQKMMEARNDTQWSKWIPELLHLYHNQEHRTIKMTPIEAEQPENQDILRETYEANWRRRDTKKKKPKFKVGDTVRISASNLQQFRRGYHAPMSVEYFFVDKVLTNFHIPRYKLREHNKNKPMSENFWEDEMVLYNPPADKEWIIENINWKDTKNKGARKMVLVKYYGFPDWEYVLASSIKDLAPAE